MIGDDKGGPVITFSPEDTSKDRRGFSDGGQVFTVAKEMKAIRDRVDFAYKEIAKTRNFAINKINEVTEKANSAIKKKEETDKTMQAVVLVLVAMVATMLLSLIMFFSNTQQVINAEANQLRIENVKIVNRLEGLERNSEKPSKEFLKIQECISKFGFVYECFK